MTPDDRDKIMNIGDRLNGLNTDKVPKTPDHKYFPTDFNADSLAETDNHKVMTAKERDKIANIDKQIAAVQTACVTDSKAVGWAVVIAQTEALAELPSGYVVTAVYRENGGGLRLGGRQPQLFIANRDYFPLCAW